jgi:hypothetical protein
MKVPIEIYALNMLTEMSQMRACTTQQDFGMSLDSNPYGSHGIEHETTTTMTTATLKSEKR